MTRLDEKVEELKAVIDEIGNEVEGNYTLADAIREGCSVTTKAVGWGNGDTACALSSAVIAAKARGFA